MEPLSRYREEKGFFSHTGRTRTRFFVFFFGNKGRVFPVLYVSFFFLPNISFFYLILSLINLLLICLKKKIDSRRTIEIFYKRNLNV